MKTKAPAPSPEFTQSSLACDTGLLDFSVGQVRLFINTEDEDAYIESNTLTPDMQVMEALEQLAQRLGWEVLPESESPAVILGGGGLRHYLTLSIWDGEVSNQREGMVA